MESLDSVRGDGLVSTYLSARLDRRRLLRLLGAAATAAGVSTALAACGGGEATETSDTDQGTSGGTQASPSGSSSTAPADSGPKQGGQLIIARSGDSDSLDPQHTIASISWQVFQHIYDPLIGKNLDLEYEGILAEKWEISDDGKEVVFQIRPGIKFHDGTDLDAEAVAFSFTRLMDPATNAPAASWVSPLQKTEAVDDSTVKMTLSEAFSPLLGNISSAYFGIVSPAAVDQYGPDFGQHPVGTGPFKFKEWIAGQSITLERNPDYQNFHSTAENRGAPYIDEIVFRNIPEEQTQVASLETGEINCLLTVPPHSVERFEDHPDVQLYKTETSTSISFIEFHMMDPQAEYGQVYNPPFDDVRVRQAVAYAVNADEIIQSVLDGLATRNYGPMPTGNYGYDPKIEEYGYHYDPEKAKALLDEAGWVPSGDGPRQKDGQPLHVLFWTWNATTQQKVAQVIQNQLMQVGFDVQLETMEVATLLGRLGKPDDPSHSDLMGWGWSEPDLLYMMTDTESGIGWYREEEYRKLVTQARQVSDLEERARLYFEAMKVMLRDCAMVPLWTALSVMGTRKEVKGFKLDGQGYPVYMDISIEQ